MALKLSVSPTAPAIEDLSGGMKRRLNLAVALLHDPELLLLDEPDHRVDPQDRNAIFDNIEELRRRGRRSSSPRRSWRRSSACDPGGGVDHGQVVADDTLGGLKQRAHQAPTACSANWWPFVAMVGWPGSNAWPASPTRRTRRHAADPARSPTCTAHWDAPWNICGRPKSWSPRSSRNSPASKTSSSNSPGRSLRDG
jgi:hypothetical protein